MEEFTPDSPLQEQLREVADFEQYDADFSSVPSVSEIRTLVEEAHLKNVYQVVHWSAALMDSFRLHDMEYICDYLTTYPSDDSIGLKDNLRTLFWYIIFGEIDLILTRTTIQIFSHDLDTLKIPKVGLHENTCTLLEYIESNGEVFFDRIQRTMEGNYVMSHMRHRAIGFARFVDSHRPVFLCCSISIMVKYVALLVSGGTPARKKPIFNVGFHPDILSLILIALDNVLTNYCTLRINHQIPPRDDPEGTQKIDQIHSLCSHLRIYNSTDFMDQYLLTVEKSGLDQETARRGALYPRTSLLLTRSSEW